MARWEQDRCIDAEISSSAGEVMLSASDVIAWLRHCAETMQPKHLHTPAIEAIADRLAGNWIQAASEQILGDDR